MTVVRDGEHGWLSTDPAALVPPLRRLLADRDLAVELGRRARQRVAERFGLDRFVDDWERIIELVADEGPRAAAAAMDRRNLLRRSIDVGTAEPRVSAADEA